MVSAGMGGSRDWDCMRWLGAPRGCPSGEATTALLLCSSFPKFSQDLWELGSAAPQRGRGSFLDVLSVCSSSCPQHPHDGCHWAALLLVVLGSQELPWPELPPSGHGLSASQTPLAPFVLQIPLLVEPALQSCVFSSSGAESEILPSSK